MIEILVAVLVTSPIIIVGVVFGAAWITAGIELRSERNRGER